LGALEGNEQPCVPKHGISSFSHYRTGQIKLFLMVEIKTGDLYL